MGEPDAPATLVRASWYDCSELTYDCPPDCPVDEACDHVVETSAGRQLEFEYSDGTVGHLVPFDPDDEVPEFSQS